MSGKRAFFGREETMKIGGLEKVSLIDYPGEICAVVFTQGCNFRCPYCHNPELVDPERYGPCLAEKEIIRFLSSRRGKLDAVTITGGEPTLQKDLPYFVGKIRKMGFAVKLDTNGSLPEVVGRLLGEKLIDYIAMDVKAPLEKYEAVTGVPQAAQAVRESIRLILRSDISHEFRLTLVPGLVGPDDVPVVAREIAGARRFALQKFRAAKTLNRIYLDKETYPDEVFLKIKEALEKDIPTVIVR